MELLSCHEQTLENYTRLFVSNKSGETTVLQTVFVLTQENGNKKKKTNEGIKRGGYR
jgi:ribulose bisphosphate carboxylase small subunit